MTRIDGTEVTPNELAFQIWKFDQEEIYSGHIFTYEEWKKESPIYVQRYINVATRTLKWLHEGSKVNYS